MLQCIMKEEDSHTLSITPQTLYSKNTIFIMVYEYNFTEEKYTWSKSKLILKHTLFLRYMDSKCFTDKMGLYWMITMYLGQLLFQLQYLVFVIKLLLFIVVVL